MILLSHHPFLSPPQDAALAQRLISLYFSLFHAHVALVERESEARDLANAAKRKDIMGKLRALKSSSAASSSSSAQKGGKHKKNDGSVHIKGGNGNGSGGGNSDPAERERQNLRASLRSLKRGGADARNEVEMVHAKLMSALLVRWRCQLLCFVSARDDASCYLWLG